MVRVVVAASSWTLSGTLAVVRTLSGVTALTVWVVMAVGLAAIPTMALLMEHVAKRALNDAASQHAHVVDEVAEKIADSLTEPPTRLPRR